MAELDITLKNLDEIFPSHFTQEQIARCKTSFLKNLSLALHKFYGGKITAIPKAGIYGLNWFNVWYTPGVSKISTTIRDDSAASFDLTNRGNLVAVVSDSTRVLGDGDCSPSGGLGVMEGKVFLMKYLGGCDGVALCMDSRNEKGENDARKIIDFVKMAAPSFGAVNLEDISQPNCFEVLDTLVDECNIPVWHDDAQGTGCVTLAAMINALKVTGKELEKIRIVFHGAGASNTTICRLLELEGADPENIIMFDSKGALGKHREDVRSDRRYYRKWEICEKTNPRKILTMDEAMKGADVIIALSKPGPDVIKPEQIALMARNSIVFACANPIPEIYPHAAHEAGALIVATGRGDFANQVNNSLGFPGILKGALLARARKITDSMAVAAAHSLAESAEKKGLSPEYIIPGMDEEDVFPSEAVAVAVQAERDGVAGVPVYAEEVFRKADNDIKEARQLTHKLMELNIIKAPPASLLENALELAIRETV